MGLPVPMGLPAPRGHLERTEKTGCQARPDLPELQA